MTTQDVTADETGLDFNPMMSPHREDPYLFFRAARARPVVFSPSIGAYLVSRYADLKTVIDDPDTFSSSAALPKIYDNPPETVAELRAGNVRETPMVVNEDEPQHRPMRRIFDAGFTGARVRAMVPRMRKRAGELVDGFTGNRADLVTEYAVPFVQTVINEVLGFPAEDAERIQAWTDDFVLLMNPLAPVAGKVTAARRMGEYTRYLQVLIDDRRAHPRDDLISDLVHGANGFPGLDDDYVLNIVRGGRVAGFDTTRAAITTTVLLLLQHPGLHSRVQTDPTRVIPKVTEEALRRDTPQRGLFRITTRETVLGDTLLPEGTLLLLLFGSGNRDETIFPDPDTADVDRPNVRAHLAFGRGLHRCPGAPMARTQIRVALETLIQRLPGLRLADDYEPTYIASYYFRSLESLRVVW